MMGNSLGKRMSGNVTPEESFLIQAHALIEIIVKLSDEERNNSDLFIELKGNAFGQSAHILHQNGTAIFGGQGSLLLAFYSLLVLPFEWEKRKISSFKSLDLSEARRTANEQACITTQPQHDILRHMRNAFAHGRLGWTDQNELQLIDRDRAEKIVFEANFSMSALGNIAQSLNDALATYVHDNIAARGRE